MALYQNKFRIESTRLKEWDYAASGWYFVTLCAQGRVCFFGDVVSNQMQLSDIGETAQRLWVEIPSHFEHVRLDHFIVMPNHLHGIIEITNDSSPVGIPNKFGPLKSKSLQSIVHSYKSAVTHWCRMYQHDEFAWQSRFYDHIIRSEKSLIQIQRYIAENPQKWALDRNNPNHL